MAESGGIRRTEYEYEMTLSRVEDLMVQAYPWKQIVAIMVSEGYTDSEKSVRNWRAEIQRRWAQEEQEMRPARKDLWRARLDQQYRAVLERAAQAQSDHAFSMLHAEATRIAKVAIDMDGLTAPIAVHHESVDIASMSPLDREREIAALLAKREAAQREGN